ncbi:hypothetical protein EDD11_005487, partial [Mortierella claussenii]
MRKITSTRTRRRSNADKKRPLSVFFLPKDLLDSFVYQLPTLSVSSHSGALHDGYNSSNTSQSTPKINEALMVTRNNNDDDSTSTSQPHTTAAQLRPSSCRSCGIAQFESVQDQRQHAKSDWHRYNLKLHLLDKTAEPITEDHFQQLLRLEQLPLSSVGSSSKSTSSSNRAAAAVGHNLSAASGLISFSDTTTATQQPIESLMNQLEITVRQNQAVRLQQQQAQQQVLEKQLKEILISPMLWFTSSSSLLLHDRDGHQQVDDSVRFGIYKNVFLNRGDCEDLTGLLKSLQYSVPAPLPKQSNRARRRAIAAAAAAAKATTAQTQETPSIDDVEAVDKAITPTSPPVGDLIQSNVPINPTTSATRPPRYWTLILLGGGHFAGMVVDLEGQISKAHGQGSHARDMKIMVHKTFHRYT